MNESRSLRLDHLCDAGLLAAGAGVGMGASSRRHDARMGLKCGTDSCINSSAGSLNIIYILVLSSEKWVLKQPSPIRWLRDLKE